MSRFVVISSLVTAVVAVLIARQPSPAHAATSCATKDFKTELVKRACASGGQASAKDAMKAFNKEKKIKSCNQCHAKLAPSYELKADAVAQFKKLGGK